MKKVNPIFLVFIFIMAAWCTISVGEAESGEDYTALFPSPLTGWEASEVTVQVSKKELDPDMNILFGEEEKKIFLARTYREINNQGATILIEIDTWDIAYNLLIPTTPEAKKELEETYPDMKPFIYQSYNGVKAYENKRLVGIAILIDLGQGFTISSDTVDEENIIMEYLKRSDLQKIHAFMKQH